MAIRPTDLQSALIYQTQAPPTGQRAEEAPRAAQAAAQSQFVAETDERTERVAEATAAEGNKIEVRDRPADGQPGGKRRKPAHKPDDPFGDVVDAAAGLSDETEHTIDFSA